MADHVARIIVWEDHTTSVEIAEDVPAADRALLLLTLANRLRDLAATGAPPAAIEGLPSDT